MSKNLYNLYENGKMIGEGLTSREIIERTRTKNHETKVANYAAGGYLLQGRYKIKAVGDKEGRNTILRKQLEEWEEIRLLVKRGLKKLGHDIPIVKRRD